MVETPDLKRPFPLFTAAVLLIGLSLLFVVFFIVSKLIQKNPEPVVVPRQDERVAALTKEIEHLKGQLDQERKNGDNLRWQHAEMIVQRENDRKKIAELTDRLKAIHGDERSIRRWFLTGADAPEKGWSLVPSVSPDKSSTAWKWTESTRDDILIGGATFACAGFLASSETAAAIEVTATTTPLLWVNHREVPSDGSTQPPFKYRVTLDAGFNLVALHVPFNRSSPFFAARLTCPNGETLRTVRILSTPSEWSAFVDPARPALATAIGRIIERSAVNPSREPSPVLARIRELLDPGERRVLENDLKALADSGILAFPLPKLRDGANDMLWMPRWTEGFDREEPGVGWRTASGTWKIHDGALCGQSAAEAAAAAAVPVSGDIRVAYDAVLIEGRGDLSCFLFGSEQHTYRDGYFLGFGSNGNAHSKILRRGEPVDRNPAALFTPGRRHHVVAERIGNVVRMFVDGTLATSFDDRVPLSVGNVWGFYTYGAHAHFDNVVFSEGRRLASPETAFLRRAATKGISSDLLKKNGIWESLITDDFERPEIDNRWRPTNGTWKIEQGALCGQDIAEAVIMLDDRVPGNVRIEYDATMIGGHRQSDLSVVLHGTAERGHEDGYFVGFGSNANARSKILRRGEEILVNALARHTPGKRHRIAVEDVEGIIRMSVDGETILLGRDPDPIGGDKRALVGFYTFGAHAHFDNVTVFHMPSLIQVSWEDRVARTIGGESNISKENLQRLFGDPSTIDDRNIALLPHLRLLSAADDPETRHLARAMVVRLLLKIGALAAWEKAWTALRRGGETNKR